LRHSGGLRRTADEKLNVENGQRTELI
jgi:hypothetical protein